MQPKNSPNPRTSAAKILQSVIYQGESLSSVLLDAEDPLVRDLCYGSLRWHEPLSALLNELLTKKIKKKDKDVECLIRVGLYQIIYQNIPDHAAVGETVSALKGLKKPWAKNLVNAVLRNYLRGQEKLQRIIHEQEPAKFAFPQWLIDEIRQAWPDSWQTVLYESNQRAPMTLRVNLSIQSRDDYLMKLQTASIKAKLNDRVETAIQLEKPCNVFDLPGFEKGEVSVQDGAAQLASALLDCKDGMVVLDACAAPGGKTGHILESAKNLEVTAIDSSASRLERVAQNLQRLALKAKVITSDVLEPDNYAKNKLFDRILLDAPCSATGVIRRHPDIKVLRRKSDIKELQKLQKEMLDVLWEKLKPEGILVYATCSIFPQENEQQIVAFLQQHSDAKALAVEGSKAYGRQILPGENSLDGFYLAKIQKIT